MAYKDEKKDLKLPFYAPEGPPRVVVPARNPTTPGPGPYPLIAECPLSSTSFGTTSRPRPSSTSMSGGADTHNSSGSARRHNPEDFDEESSIATTTATVGNAAIAPGCSDDDSRSLLLPSSSSAATSVTGEDAASSILDANQPGNGLEEGDEGDPEARRHNRRRHADGRSGSSESLSTLPPLPTTFLERLKYTLDYVHARVFGGMPRKLILILAVIDGLFLLARLFFVANGLPGMARIALLLFIELGMLMVSAFIYKRLIHLVPGHSSKSLWARHGKKVVIPFALAWVGMAHLSWMFFYVPLPGDFFFPVVCFMAIGTYIHASVLLFAFFFLERIIHLVAPKTTTPILRSENMHTWIALIVAFIVCAHGFSVATGRPNLKTLNIPIDNLPAEFDGFSIVLVTDIHMGPTVGRARMEQIAQVINQVQPDVVAFSGDLVDGYVDFLAPRTKPIASIRARYGKYFVTGNHEYMHENVDHWMTYFENDLNITALHNKGVVLEKSPNAKLCLAGVDDVYTEAIHFPGHMMDPAKALADCPNNTSTVMLVHQPNGAGKVINMLPKIGKNVDLILSGHTHAGQMFVVWPLSFFSNKYFFGLYKHEESGTQIYVSSGVNYWGPPIKMPNLCEIVNVRLHRAAQ